MTADEAAIRGIVSSTGFFSPAEVEVAVELVQERLRRGNASGYFFVFAETDRRTVGYACYGPIACTIGSFDLYWIAVHKDYQHRGLGRSLLVASERKIAESGGRRIYVETSSARAVSADTQFLRAFRIPSRGRLGRLLCPGRRQGNLLQAGDSPAVAPAAASRCRVGMALGIPRWSRKPMLRSDRMVPAQFPFTFETS